MLLPFRQCAVAAQQSDFLCLARYLWLLRPGSQSAI
jgi:hypothetical protein